MYEEVIIKHQDLVLKGHLTIPEHTRSWVIFAHGSGSSRHSARNNWIAGELNKHGYATLLFDLLTEAEDHVVKNRFDIDLLATRLLTATNWLLHSHHAQDEPIVFFGASTGAAAALMAAARIDHTLPLYTVICRGGRPDLAGPASLRHLSIPVLLIVGELDQEVIELNQKAMHYLKKGRLMVVEGASHLFEEEGKLSEVVDLSLSWLARNLPYQEETQRWAL